MILRASGFVFKATVALGTLTGAQLTALPAAADLEPDGETRARDDSIAQAQLEVGTGPIIALDEVDAPGIMGSVDFAVSDDPLLLAARVAAFGTQGRELESDELGGVIVWSRPAFGAGVRVRVPLPRRKSAFALDLDARALFGLVLVRGDGYPDNRRSFGHDVGFGGEIRPTFRFDGLNASNAFAPLS